MKKLLIMAIITTAPAVFAELRVNNTTGMFYSHGAKNDVNQTEYNDLCYRFIVNASSGSTDVSVIAIIRAIGTPTAIRLVHDFKLFIKSMMDDRKMLYGI